MMDMKREYRRRIERALSDQGITDEMWFRLAYSAYCANTVGVPEFGVWRDDAYATWLVNVLKHVFVELRIVDDEPGGPPPRGQHDA